MAGDINVHANEASSAALGKYCQGFEGKPEFLFMSPSYPSLQRLFRKSTGPLLDQIQTGFGSHSLLRKVLKVEGNDGKQDVTLHGREKTPARSSCLLQGIKMIGPKNPSGEVAWPLVSLPKVGQDAKSAPVTFSERLREEKIAENQGKVTFFSIIAVHRTLAAERIELVILGNVE